MSKTVLRDLVSEVLPVAILLAPFILTFIVLRLLREKVRLIPVQDFT